MKVPNTHGFKRELPVKAEPSTLEKDTALLAARIGWVPPGWAAIYQDMIARLRALDRQAHGATTINGPWIEDAVMTFTLSQSDAVVTGVLNKTTRRSQYTCKVCGAAAKVRHCAGVQQVLCARCYAPRDLSYQLGFWLRRLKRASFAPLAQVLCVDDFSPAMLALIPENKWRWPADRSRDDATPFLLSTDLLAMTDDFECLFKHIESQMLINE